MIWDRHAAPSSGAMGERALDSVAVIMPAFRAERLIGPAVRSVIAQTYPHWELWLVSDDGTDYEALLATMGMRDRRIRQLSSGVVGGGASRARNLALERIEAPYAAILDADDRMKPDKLARAVAALAEQAIVSFALDVMDDSYRHLRHVGSGPDLPLDPGKYKFTCLSMDSMLVWDRRRTDARYDLEMTNMTDLEFLMQLWRSAPATFHLGTPLHDYVKVMGSMSNAAGVTAKMIASKTALIDRLAAGRYPLAGGGAEGLAAFLDISRQAEADYPAAVAERPGLLFEDHLEPRLRAAPSR
jgi:hypothetical protein